MSRVPPATLHAARGFSVLLFFCGPLMVANHPAIRMTLCMTRDDNHDYGALERNSCEMLLWDTVRIAFDVILVSVVWALVIDCRGAADARFCRCAPWWSRGFFSILVVGLLLSGILMQLVAEFPRMLYGIFGHSGIIGANDVCRRMVPLRLLHEGAWDRA